jgi:hypothetical protein
MTTRTSLEFLSVFELAPRMSPSGTFLHATNELALQLQLIEGSESMGDHDSGSDDWWCAG